MINEEDPCRDLGSLVVRRVGSLVATYDPWEPYRLLDSSGAPVAAAAAYLGELQAAGRSTATQRSYGLALLRWFRFLWAVEIPWREATRTEARDFSRWIQITAKPVRPHWRSPDKPPVVKPKVVNPVTGKRPPGGTYAPSTIAHCETVLRGFYAYHLEAGTGPLVNPFPLARAGRANAHHNPMDRFERQRAGLYRPRQPSGSRGRSRTRCSTSCSRVCPMTGTGRWWRSGCRPGRGPRSCWGCCAPAPTRDDS